MLYKLPALNYHNLYSRIGKNVVVQNARVIKVIFHYFGKLRPSHEGKSPISHAPWQKSTHLLILLIKLIITYFIDYCYKTPVRNRVHVRAKKSVTAQNFRSLVLQEDCVYRVKLRVLTRVNSRTRFVEFPFFLGTLLDSIYRYRWPIRFLACQIDFSNIWTFGFWCHSRATIIRTRYTLISLRNKYPPMRIIYTLCPARPKNSK